MNLPDPVSFEKALTKFLDYLKLQKRSSATTTAYGSDLLQLHKHLLDHRITQATTIATDHLQAYIDHLGQKGYTPKSISRKINSFKTFFKYLHTEKIIIENPAHPLVHPKVTAKAPRILTPTEVRNLREAARLDIRIGSIIELLLQTGMRISELANLKVNSIKKNELHIDSIENNPARTIPLGRAAHTAIQNYMSQRPKIENPNLFITKTGRPLLIRNIRTSIDRYFKKAGLKDVKVNDLRHTFIAHQLKSGIDPDTVYKHVGHKRLSSTQKYLDHVKIEISEVTSAVIEL